MTHKAKSPTLSPQKSEFLSPSPSPEKGLCQWGDPGGIPGVLGWRNFGEQIMIDALIKVPERQAVFPPRSEPVAWEKEAIKRMADRVKSK